MINFVGINFDKYPLLKSIEKYCTMNELEFQYINFFTKNNLSVLETVNCDIIVYVEIDPVSDTVPYISVKEGVDGRTAAAAFKKLVKESKEPISEDEATRLSINLASSEAMKVAFDHTFRNFEPTIEEQLPEGRSYIDPDTMASAARSTIEVAKLVGEEFTKAWAEDSPPWEDEPVAIEQAVSLLEVVSESKVQELDGVQLNVNGKIVYLSKDDFSKFLEVKELTESLGYTIEEVIVK